MNTDESSSTHLLQVFSGICYNMERASKLAAISMEI